jgi:hypothetical protein
MIKRNNYKEWIDSQIGVMPFFIYLGSIWDHASEEQRKEILRLRRLMF